VRGTGGTAFMRMDRTSGLLKPEPESESELEAEDSVSDEADESESELWGERLAWDSYTPSPRFISMYSSAAGLSCSMSRPVGSTAALCWSSWVDRSIAGRKDCSRCIKSGLAGAGRLRSSSRLRGGSAIECPSRVGGLDNSSSTRLVRVVGSGENSKTG